MATTQEYAEYVCQQAEGAGTLRLRKMFGEYMIYVNEKPLLLVCDNTVFVKRLPALAPLLKDSAVGCPYDGAKEHYLLDPDDRETLLRVIAALEPITPLPKRKKVRT